MGAMFEVAIISKKFIPFQIGVQYLQTLGQAFAVKNLQCIKDWDWNDQHDLELNLDQQVIEPLLEAGRIVLLYGTMAGIDVGIFLQQNEDKTYQTDFWFDESLYEFLKISALRGGATFYKKLETELENNLTLFAPYSMVLVVMGEEMVFEYSPNLAKMRDHCRVDRWITFERQGDGSSVLTDSKEGDEIPTNDEIDE